MIEVGPVQSSEITVSGRSQVGLRSVSGRSQVGLRSVSGRSQVGLRSVSGRSQVSGKANINKDLLSTFRIFLATLAP
jgi:hypothetical protein